MADILEHCRLCYGDVGNEGTDIFLRPSPENSYSKAIANCLRISLRVGPKWPRKCCERCLEEFLDINLFKGKVMLTQNTLKDFLPEEGDPVKILTNEPSLTQDKAPVCDKSTFTDPPPSEDRFEEDSYSLTLDKPSVCDNSTATVPPPSEDGFEEDSSSAMGLCMPVQVFDGFDEEFVCKVESADPLEEESGMDFEEDSKETSGSDPMFFCETIAKSSASSDNKSARRYVKVYDEFFKWLKEIDHEGPIDSKLIANYMIMLLSEKNRHISNMPSVFSMLKSQLKDRNSVELEPYATIKDQVEMWKPADSETRTAPSFTRDEVLRFVNEAPDKKWLVDKVIFILSVWGGLPIAAIFRLMPEDVKCDSTHITVHARTIDKTITIPQSPNCNIIRIFQLYMSISSHVTFPLQKFLLRINNNMEARSHNAGINTVLTLFKRVAKWLGLPNAFDYSGKSGVKTHQLVSTNSFFANDPL